MTDLKYKTLAEFAAARRAGATSAVLTVDSDTVAAYEDDGDGPLVLQMHAEEALSHALDLLGLPHEHV